MPDRNIFFSTSKESVTNTNDDNAAENKKCFSGGFTA